MHACMHACTHVRTCVRTHPGMRVCIYAHRYVPLMKVRVCSVCIPWLLTIMLGFVKIELSESNQTDDIFEKSGTEKHRTEPVPSCHICTPQAKHRLYTGYFCLLTMLFGFLTVCRPLLGRGPRYRQRDGDGQITKPNWSITCLLNLNDCYYYWFVAPRLLGRGPRYRQRDGDDHEQ